MSQPNFLSIFGFEKFHSKFQNTSFSLGISIKSICRSSCDKNVAKCVPYTLILSGYVDDQSFARSFILASCNIWSKKPDNETDENFLATKNFATCGEPLDMIWLLHVKSLKETLMLWISWQIDARADLDNKTLFNSKLSSFFFSTFLQ